MEHTCEVVIDEVVNDGAECQEDDVIDVLCGKPAPWKIEGGWWLCADHYDHTVKVIAGRRAKLEIPDER